ncbi:MAG: hypothetical protein MHM6MM_002798 [Cercozoa sp. M6MM]
MHDKTELQHDYERLVVHMNKAAGRLKTTLHQLWHRLEQVEHVVQMQSTTTEITRTTESTTTATTDATTTITSATRTTTTELCLCTRENANVADPCPSNPGIEVPLGAFCTCDFECASETCSETCVATQRDGSMFTRSGGHLCVSTSAAAANAECSCNSECAANLVCLQNPAGTSFQCAQLPIRAACDPAADLCGSELMCDTERSTCVLQLGVTNQDCSTRADCPDGTLCDISNGNCVQSTGGACANDDFCVGTCVNGISSNPIDPLGPLVCLLLDGETCSLDTECASGKCDNAPGGSSKCLVTPYSQEVRRQSQGFSYDYCTSVSNCYGGVSCVIDAWGLEVCDFAGPNTACSPNGSPLECSMNGFDLQIDLASALCGAQTAGQCPSPCGCSQQGSEVLLPVDDCPSGTGKTTGQSCLCDFECTGELHLFRSVPTVQ